MPAEHEVDNSIAKFIADRWVSWVLELAVMGAIAYFTIAETRKTMEQTRDMLARYDAAISGYAKEKTEAVDAATSQAVERLRDKADSLSKDDFEKLFKLLKSGKTEPGK